MKIYLIRHSESEDDLNDCYGGCADWKLTENGRVKVENFRGKFNTLNVQKIFSSPYQRAYETAVILNNDSKVEIEKAFDLREINTYGVMSGVNKTLAKELFAFYLSDLQFQNIGYYNGKSFYGGESVEEFDGRVKKSIDFIVGQGLESVAIVTHGGVFRSIFKNILHESRKIIAIEDVAMVEIDFDNFEYKVIGINGITFE